MLSTGRRCLGVLTRKTQITGPSSRYSQATLPSQGPKPEYDAQENVKDVAVLGGGITGLASAYYIAKRFPNAAITVYESSDRFGGWLRSSEINVDGGKVVFEQGPRTLLPRGSGSITIDLIRQLGLELRALSTSKTSPAARNRYIYYPDHLVRLPSPAGSLVDSAYDLASLIASEEPLVEGIVKEVLHLFINSTRSSHDESIASWFSRNGAPRIAENIVSAMAHGIYAGDIYQLSMQSIFPGIVAFEQRYGSLGVGSLIAKFVKQKSENKEPTTFLDEFKQTSDWTGASSSSSEAVLSITNSSVYTLRDGLETLPRTLIEYLENHTNVKLLKSRSVQAIERCLKNKVRVITARKAGTKAAKEFHEFTHVVSAIRPSTLKRICSPLLQNPEFDMTPAVTVMVVNLYYNDPDLLSVKGFGYLLPRSLPLGQNPERALGVVFDSASSVGLDTVPGTKLTVMLGGHWWDKLPVADLPDEKDGETLARSVLEAHLNVTAKPAAVKVTLARDCIPQYVVGHCDRMISMNGALLKAFEGRLRVAGSWYEGVGVNDCIAAGYRTAFEMERFPYRCGLEKFLHENQPWALPGPKKEE